MIMHLLPSRLQAFLCGKMHRFILNHGYIPFDTSHNYAEDGLFTFHNDSFRADTVFRAAYARGIRAGHGVDPHFEWRIHVALWAAAAWSGTLANRRKCTKRRGPWALRFWRCPLVRV